MSMSLEEMAQSLKTIGLGEGKARSLVYVLTLKQDVTEYKLQKNSQLKWVVSASELNNNLIGELFSIPKKSGETAKLLKNHKFSVNALTSSKEMGDIFLKLGLLDKTNNLLFNCVLDQEDSELELRSINSASSQSTDERITSARAPLNRPIRPKAAKAGRKTQ